jgi:hypothetical protein
MNRRPIIARSIFAGGIAFKLPIVSLGLTNLKSLVVSDQSAPECAIACWTGVAGFRQVKPN